MKASTIGERAEPAEWEVQLATEVLSKELGRPVEAVLVTTGLALTETGLATGRWGVFTHTFVPRDEA